MGKRNFTLAPDGTCTCNKCGSTERTSLNKCKPCTKAMAKIRSAIWYATNKEKAIEQAKRWRQENPEKRKIIVANWAKNNPQRVAENAVKYRIKNLERVTELKAKWYSENREAYRTYVINRRYKTREIKGNLSKGLIDKLLVLQKGKCACCKKPLGKSYHLDHIMPLSLGGANSDENMQLLTATCNLQKHAKHPVDFMQSRGFLL